MSHLLYRGVMLHLISTIPSIYKYFLNLQISGLVVLNDSQRSKLATLIKQFELTFKTSNDSTMHV